MQEEGAGGKDSAHEQGKEGRTVLPQPQPPPCVCVCVLIIYHQEGEAVRKSRQDERDR